MIVRFTRDLLGVWRALDRITKSTGKVVMVVADSQLRGVGISNSAICQATAQLHGFKLQDQATRQLPARHRYLPPPAAALGALSQRMKQEVVLTFGRIDEAT